MLYTYAAAAIVALALGFTSGWKVHAWKADADKVAQLRADNATALRRAERVDQAAQSLETAKEDIRARTRAITNEALRLAARPVYRDRCLDADGLQLVAAAAAGAAADPGQPAPALSASAAAR